jgi:hypothetical protein
MPSCPLSLSVSPGAGALSAKWIRFAVKKCGTPKKRADSMDMETALDP